MPCAFRMAWTPSSSVSRRRAMKEAMCPPASAYDQRHGRSIHIVRHLIESDYITLAENEELMVQFTANLGEHVDNRLKPGFAAFRQGS